MARRSIHTGAWQENLLGGASLVAVGDRIFTTGLMARDSVSLESEAHQVFSTLAGLLHDAGSNLADVVRTRLFYTADGADEALRAVHGVVFNSPGPAISAVRVARLPREAEVALEVEAIRGAAGSMTHHEPDEAAGSSAAVRVGNEVFVGGVTAPHAGDHAAQMSAVFAVAGDALAALGVSPADVTATRHYYSFEQRDERAPSGEDPQSVFMAAGEPTSAGICVAAAGPAGTTFAFECEAVEGASASRNNVRSGRTFEVEHHYSRAVRVDDVVYVAGSTSIVPGETVRHPGDVRGQVLDTLETIRWAIEEQGLDWGDTVRTRSYIVGGADRLDEAAAAIAEVTGELDAVHTLTGVPVLGRPEVVVEIEATAVRDS
jgi:enamine deaminase RidA (YjgF/YER057c/UK114 family)